MENTREDTTSRWLLAFDASCGACRKVAATVERASGQHLEVVPLDRPDVAEWRAAALGPDAPWVPTLLRARGTAARAWTGARMSLPLARLLGPRGTVRVLHALGDLSASGNRSATAPPSSTGDAEGLPRKGFLRLVTGGVVAGTLVLAGRTPALADSGGQEVRDWLRQHEGSLPTEYAEVVAHPTAYRRAIYGASAPEVKQALWLAHFEEYARTRDTLTADQRAVITRARAVVQETPDLFSRTIISGDGRDQVVAPLRDAAIDAFGKEEARALIAHLGPVSDQDVRIPDCSCALGDPNWCGGTCRSCCYVQLGCGGTSCRCCCTYLDDGCGSLWAHPCDGVCNP
ncbi:bacteriocin fulvocin C-related protein [Streptomyces sp. NPDC004111]|uniref:bacteriocin fulvocin C-related protein n=1 Tax=Streptomyces sp. NPDC004111 TaxID=3364690 RepID=UPI00369F8276